MKIPVFNNDLVKLNYFYLIFGSDRESIKKCLKGEYEGVLYCTFNVPNYITREDKLNKRYQKEVHKLTSLIDTSGLKHSDKRAFKGYHLDHKYSIHAGFKNNVPKEMIADIRNLRFISHKENMAKGTRCFIDEDNKYILEWIEENKYSTARKNNN